MLILGAHTIDNGGIQMAVRRAARSGMRALQVFTAKPQFYNEKISVRPERVERFKAALAGTDIRPEHIVAHAAYVLSVATRWMYGFHSGCASPASANRRLTRSALR